MTESPAKSLSVELDVDAIKPIVSGFRSYGEGVVAGLTNGGVFPTVWDSFQQFIEEGWMIRGAGLESGDLVPDWQLYTREQTGTVEHPEMLSSDSPDIFQRKIVAQIRNLLWDGTSLSFPRNMWESLGVASWGSTEFQILYADAIRSILRERYILSADERKEVPCLSPKSFWLLLSLASPGLDALANPLHYKAVSEIRVMAKAHHEKECWAGFWDQWFLGEIGEILKRSNKSPSMDFNELNRFLVKLPLFNDKPSEVTEKTISIPYRKLKQNVPSWYANNTGYV